jgi:hypothetical protein
MTLRLNGSTSGFTEIDAPAVAGSNTLTLPGGNGTNGQVLTTDGAGALSFTTVAENLADGSSTTPSVAFASDVNTGIFRAGNDLLAFSTGGTQRAQFDASGRLLVGTSSTSSECTTEFRGRSSGSASSLVRLCTTTSALAANETQGVLAFGSADTTATNAGAWIYAQRDGGTWTNNSSMPSRLVFSTTADGASSPTERMRIRSDGETALYHNNYGVSFRTAASSSGSIEIIYCTRNATNVTNGTGVYAVYTNGTYATLSDQTQKKNIETTRDGYLDDLNKLRVVKYNWNEQEDNEPKELGLIAQEVEQVFPGLINEMRSEEGELPKKGVKAGVLPYMLIKALQEATARIETLEARLTALEVTP